MQEASRLVAAGRRPCKLRGFVVRKIETPGRGLGIQVMGRQYASFCVCLCGGAIGRRNPTILASYALKAGHLNRLEEIIQSGVLAANTEADASGATRFNYQRTCQLEPVNHKTDGGNHKSNSANEARQNQGHDPDKQERYGSVEPARRTETPSLHVYNALQGNVLGNLVSSLEGLGRDHPEIGHPHGRCWGEEQAAANEFDLLVPANFLPLFIRLSA